MVSLPSLCTPESGHGRIDGSVIPDRMGGVPDRALQGVTKGNGVPVTKESLAFRDVHGSQKRHKA